MEKLSMRTSKNMTPEELKRVKAEECRTMIAGLERNAEITRRYLRRFSRCLPAEVFHRGLVRFERLTSQAAEQRRILSRVVYTPPRQLVFDNFF